MMGLEPGRGEGRKEGGGSGGKGEKDHIMSFLISVSIIQRFQVPGAVILPLFK